MRFPYTIRFCLSLVLMGLVLAPAFARPDRDKDRDKPARRAGTAGKSSSVCTNGQAAAELDVNNVRAPVYTTGSLFYPAIGTVQYEVPKGSGINAVYATNIWIGGLANGELRMAAATYAQGGAAYEFFPGPLAADGTPPTDCTQYDRIWKINRTDIEAYEQSGTATADLAEWPYDLGAPVLDGDGNPNNYDLAAGDRPQLLGDQMLWWVMNDAAGEHLSTLAPPIGLEMQVTAFAFSTADALNNTTFYKYKLIYKPLDNSPLEDTWLGIWSDTDLGQYTDDFVGVDTTLGLGFSYNGDNFDENGSGVNGYLDRPAAVGYDFFQGPLVDSNEDGVLNPETDERLQTTRFVYYHNTNGTATGNPADVEDMYGYLRGRWTDGQPMTLGDDGYGGSVPTNFMFPGEPPGFWSEDNTDGGGTRNTPGDRRMIMSTGPFTMQPGDTQEIVFGVIWSQTADRVGSVKKLKKDDILAQGAFDFNFDLPRPPAAPNVAVSEQDGQIVLSWSNEPNQNNYLNQYDAPSPFLVDVNANDQTYTFEGYKIFQYDSPNTPPEEGTLIATFDVPNNVQAIVDTDIDPRTGAAVSRVVAEGTDSGVQNFIVVDRDVFTDRQIRNYTQYYFGVQAYAYNPNSDPKVYQSPITRVTATPSGVSQRNEGTVVHGEIGGGLVGLRTSGIGEGDISARIVDPLAITGDTYDVRFFEVELADHSHTLSYDVVNTRTGQKVVDGTQYHARTGLALPQGQDIFVAEGLSFSISGPAPTFTQFLTVSNGAGPLDPPDQGAFGFNASGFPLLVNGFDDDGDGTVDEAGETDRPSERQQVGPAEWGIHQANTLTSASFETFVDQVSRSGTNWVRILPNNFEMRFTERGGKALLPAAFAAFPDNVLIDVPFELWNIGTSPGPEDDYRMFPYVFDLESDGAFSLVADDHPISGGVDDPYTDLFYWLVPNDTSPGEAGYNALIALIESDPAGYDFLEGTQGRAIERMALVNLNGGAAPPYNADMPETGTTFRIITSKPISAGDVYTINTTDVAPERGDLETAQSALDRIGIVPNPYRAGSDYDTDVFRTEVRIINLPAQATVRVYALNGALLRTLIKTNPDLDYLAWDMRNEEGLPVASGLYLVHIDAPGIGEHVVKFGIVQKRIQLNVF